MGHRTNFPKQVLSFNFRKPFGKISYREKQRRSNFLVKELIANCVDRTQLESQGMEYLEGNIPLAKEVLIVLDLVHYRVSKILHVDDITKLDNTECYMNDDDDDDDGDVNNDNDDNYANDLAQFY